ncbi:YdbH family protein [uncultured Cedecea sp.]|uniref:YdbH family protein n=1 Tax=uncultured Cedecea sp. TaxID=988762 RepID=UPI002621D58D|nr:YdbH family protein [uncultured Cedecea sp.]
MKGKYKMLVALLLVLVLLPLSLFFSLTSWLPVVVGLWLPAGSHITLNATPEFHRGAITLGDVRYWAGTCEIAGIKDARISHSGRWQLTMAELRINPDCLSELPANTQNSDEPILLSSLQNLLPDSRVSIDNLVVTPWPQYHGALRLALDSNRQELWYQGPLVSTHLTLSQQALDIYQLQVHLDEDQPPIELVGKLTLALHPEGIPPQGYLTTQLIAPDVVGKLDVALRWKENEGILTVAEEASGTALLTLPWSVEGALLEVNGGQWHWPYAGLPLQGGVALRIDDWSQGLEKMTLSGRMNMVTEGQAGKGNVVLNIGPGKLSLLDSELPLQLTGEIKREQLIFYARLRGLLTGSVIDPTLAFQPGSLLASRGKVNEALNIDDVRWPLAGVRISSKGIEGRLQAILRARQNALGEMTLHLDGKAQHFIPGQSGAWQWNYWGNGLFVPVQAKWDVQGDGEWQGCRLQFTRLSTGFDKLEYGKMYVSNPRLQLTRPLIWDSTEDKPQLSGSFVLETGVTTFGAGGSRLSPAALSFDVDGRTPADFRFKGALQAGIIGPVRLSGRWDGERLRGDAWWPKQSLTVFQTLLPADWKMELKGGDLYAQVAFSAAAGQGFEAGGHGVVKQGSAWLPDNQINGVDFILPFRYQDSRWHLGTRGPVSLRIAEIRNQFTVENITADLQGWYPWDEQTPLNLSDVSASLLGGKVIMQQLRMPQKDVALIRLQNLSSSELVNAINPKQFTFSGRFDGGLPLWLNHPRWIVKDGWLRSSGAMTFRMDKDMADAVVANNMVAGMAIDWIRYLEITRSWATVSLDNLGEMEMSASVIGVSHNNGKTGTVNLNYHHQENLFSLWRSLRFGENLQTWLQENASLPLETCRNPGNACEEKQ